MSNFSAEIQARLNISNIESDIGKIENNRINFKNISLDTSKLVSDIQSALNHNKFTINLDKIDMSNVTNQMQKSGSTVGKSFSQSFDTGAAAAKRFEESAKKATTAINSGSIDSSIAKVTAQYEKLGTTAHSKLTSIKADIEQLSVLQSSMNNSGDTSTLVTNYEKFSDTLSRVKNNLSIVSAESKTFVSVSQISALDNKMASWMDKNSKASKDFGASIDNLRNRLSTLNSSGKATTSSLKAIEKEFNDIKQAAINAGQVGTSFGNQLKGAFSSISRYVSVSTVIFQSISALKEMYQNVYDIDTEMTELKKVTNETEASYSNFLKGAGTSAKEVGTTISDLVKSTADFSRLGYTFTDSQGLAKVANIYSVVGDEIDSIDTATKSIISTMTAFYDDADSSDALSIVDKFNEVGNNYAISSGGIGDALERSASSMAAANNTLDETIALITAANTVVQDPDSVGSHILTVPT